MECLPFVRRLTLIRTGSVPESPADFNRKAFPRRSRRRGTNSDGSMASTMSLESETDSARSSDTLSTDRCDSRLNQLSAQSTRLSPSYEDGHESQSTAGGQRRGYDVRRGIIPACVLYNQVAESIDPSTMAYSMNSELDVDIQLTDAEDFLGISIVGQNYSDGDSSLFVGTVIPGGAVSRDGRIEAGDLILSVNGHNLEGKSNKQAVEILRQAAKCSRTVRLSVIPCDNMSVYSEKSCVRPIDPFLWLAHNSFVQQNEALQGRSATAQQSSRYGGGSKSISSLASSSLSSSMPSTAATMRSRNGQRALPLETPVDIIANRLKTYALNKPGLQNGKSKSIAASSITGAHLRDWLYHNVRGFKDLEEVSMYASHLFLLGYITPIRHILDRERISTNEFRLDESYVVQTRPLSPAIRPMTPSLADGSGVYRL